MKQIIFMEPNYENKVILFILKHKIIAVALLSILLVIILGVPTALISNPFIHYIRMFPPTWVDYFFLLSTSILISANLVVFIEKKTKKDGKILGGGILGFLSIACPTCNILLVTLLGYSFILAFIEPLRPFFGLASIIILLITLYFQMKLPACEMCDDDERNKTGQSKSDAK